MMDTVGHHLYFMMLCVGMADGHLSDKEKEQCAIRVSEQVARLCEREGWDKYDIIDKKEQDILREVLSYFTSGVQTDSLGNRVGWDKWDNFRESVKMMPPSLNYDQTMLNDLYDALKKVVEADDTTGNEEFDVLEFVYAEWGLVRYGELHRL